MKSNNSKNKNSRPQKTKKKLKIKKVLKAASLVCVLAILAGAGALLYVLSGYVKDMPEFDPDMLRVAETSYFYDFQGQEVTSVRGEQNRVVVSIRSDIPQHVQNAFIAIEDERFEKHFGVDIMGIVRAAFINLRHGSIQQGASTITQQLARDAFLTRDQTFKRKIQEAWMAIDLERKYSKQEILEMYLNRIYFGNGAYGVEATAQTYFNKSIGDVSIAEAAMIAGIVNSPPFNNPHYSVERAETRMHLVLNKMEELDFITPEEAANARNEELKYADPRGQDYHFPYFLDYVIHSELLNILASLPEYGDRDAAYDAIYTHGLRIFTTINTGLQEHVENTLARSDMYPATVFIDRDKVRKVIREAGNKLPPGFKLSDYYVDEEIGVAQPQAAFVLVCPNTGQVMALGGGRELRRRIDEVRRYENIRQPGSSIKPIVAYAPAFEEGLLAPGSVIDDSPFAAGPYAPENWDFAFRGLITVRHALVRSYNVPAVTTLQMVTPQKGTDYAERMGISTFHPDDRVQLGTALGGVTNGVTALDMAQAFSVLANEGVKMPLHTVRRVEDREGNVIYTQQPEPERILSAQTAYMVTHILEEAQRMFFGNRVYIDRPVAVKTGTTDDNRDAYLGAFTPNLVSVFWMGYDSILLGNIPEAHVWAGKMTREIYTRAFQGLPVKQFVKPDGVIGPVEVCSKSGMRPTDLCREAGTVTSDYFTSVTVPHDPCIYHVEMEVCEESGLLPGEFCPRESLVLKIFLDRPPFILTDSRWRKGAGRGPEDAELMPPEETCDFHTDRPDRPLSFNAQYMSPSQVRLAWEAVQKPHRYQIFRWAEGEGVPDSPLETLSGSHTTYTDNYQFTPGKTYHYRLTALDKKNVPSEAAETTVTIPDGEDPGEPDDPPENPSPSGPELIAPSNGAKINSTKPTFYWSSVSGASGYGIEISTNPNFDDVVYQKSNISFTIYTVTSSLDTGAKYWWRVRAELDSEDTWSKKWNFQIEDTSEVGQNTGLIRGIFLSLLSPVFSR